MPIVGDLLADRYRIDGILGAGGMASVYRATDLRLDRPVALKVLSANLAADPTIALRFEREARALAAAAHPSVVAVFDVAPGDPETGREPFYVMELCEGGTLGDRLSAGGRLDPEALIPALASVAAGLAELHRRGVVHRDVKSANIVYQGDQAKLADFGLARSEEQDLTTLTADGMTVGTLAFLAPELLAGSSATPASDVYALGVTAFQGLTGRLPKDAASIGDLIEKRANAAPAVSSVATDLGTSFDEPVASALAVDAAARPEADELGTALTSALAQHTQATFPARHRRSASSRPFFDPADPFPKTAVAVPVPRGIQARGHPPLPTEETITQVPLEPVPSALPSAPMVPPRRTREVARRQPPRSLRDRPGLLVLAAFALIVLALAGLSTLIGGPSASPSLPAVIIAGSPSVALSPSLAVTPSRSALASSPSPVLASASAAARALAAVDDVIEAINAARGGGDLKGKEANELERLAADVRTRLQSNDFDEAREAAEHLEERVGKVAKDIEPSERERLEAAVAALIDAIPED
jgi:eukaryotic-like serine/threonine-protein kinase